MLARSLHALSDVIWPRSCLVCQHELPAEHSIWCICPGCIGELHKESGPSCPRCTSNIGPHVNAELGCPSCQNEKFAFTTATRMGRYEGKLRDAILMAKSVSHESLAQVLGRIYATTRRDELLKTQPHAVVPIPLHRWKRWQRGYNQSETIARGLAKELQLPLYCWALFKVRSTQTQTVMTPTERRANLKNAFRANRLSRLTGMRILLIDDVLTTGSTAHAASQALIALGAAQVHVAVLAHR